MSDDYDDKEETASEDESSETPTKEKKESDSGEESTSEHGVKVPESFQKAAHALLQQCSDKACLSYLRNCVNEKEDEYREAEMKEKSKNSPQEFSTAGMPD